MKNAKLLASKKEQHFGADPTAVRETDHYQMEYVHGLVEKWDELIDWEARAKAENNFFVNELTARDKHKVLDVATGTGYHSVTLLAAGFDVTSLDGSHVMLAKAFQNALKRGYILKTVHSDWRWLCKDVHGRYDAVICLGNSFTHLFDENDRRKALAEFYSALRHDGILILDQRNYDSILDNGYKSKHIYYYAGENIKVEPEYVDEGLARFRYAFPDNSVFHLNMYPLRVDYVHRLLREVGFQKVTTYGDFHDTYKDKDSKPDFLIHIAEKAYEGK
jgi:glycine/sarcosine N-methyltransferase